MSQLNPDDYQSRQQPQIQGCAPCWARACAGITGPCPSCLRKQNPNPYRDQDGTATSVGCPSPGTKLDLGVGTATKVVRAATKEDYVRNDELNRPMTDAERKLVDGTIAWMELRGPLPDLQLLGSAILRERNPERPITPEELAVVEAAKVWESEAQNRTNWPLSKREAALLDAARRLK